MKALKNNLSLYLLLTLVLGMDMGICIMAIPNGDKNIIVPAIILMLFSAILILVVYRMVKKLMEKIMEEVTAVCEKAADQEVTDQEHKHEKE